MNSGHLSAGTTAHHTVRKTKPRPKKTQRSKNGSNGHGPRNGEHAMAAAGTLTRTKSLLLAALRVWELKHRIGE